LCIFAHSRAAAFSGETIMSKVKSAVIVTATVLAVIAIAYRVPGVRDVVAKALTPPAA